MKNQDKYDIRNKTGVFATDGDPIRPSETFSSAAQNRPVENTFDSLLKKIYYQAFNTLPTFGNLVVSFDNVPEIVIGAPALPSGASSPWYIPFSMRQKRVAGTPDANITLNYTVGSTAGYTTYIHLGDTLAEGATYIETQPNMIVVKSKSSAELLRYKAVSLIFEHNTTSGLAASAKEAPFVDANGTHYLQYRFRFDATSKTVADLVSDMQAAMSADFDVEIVSANTTTTGAKTVEQTFMSDYATTDIREYNMIPPNFRVDIPDTSVLFPDMAAAGYAAVYAKDYHPFRFQYTDGSSALPIFSNPGIYGFVTSKMDETGGSDFQTTFTDPVGTSSTSQMVKIPFDMSTEFSTLTDMEAGDPYIIQSVLNQLDADYNFLPFFIVTNTEIKFLWGLNINIDTYLEYFNALPSASTRVLTLSHSEFYPVDKLSEEVFDYNSSTLTSGMSTMMETHVKNAGFDITSNTRYDNALKKLSYMLSRAEFLADQSNVAHPEITSEYTFKVAPANLHHWGFQRINVSDSLFSVSYALFDKTQIGGTGTDTITGSILPEGCVNILEEYVSSASLQSRTVTDILTFCQYSQIVDYDDTSVYDESNPNNRSFVGIQLEKEGIASDNYKYINAFLSKNVRNNTHEVFNNFGVSPEGRMNVFKYDAEFETPLVGTTTYDAYPEISMVWDDGENMYEYPTTYRVYDSNGEFSTNYISVRAKTSGTWSTESTLLNNNYYEVDNTTLQAVNPACGLNDNWIKSIPVSVGINQDEYSTSSIDEDVTINIGFDYQLDLSAGYISDYYEGYSRTITGASDNTFLNECMMAYRDDSDTTIPAGRSKVYSQAYFIPVMYFTTVLKKVSTADSTEAIVAVDAAPLFDSSSVTMYEDSYRGSTPSSSVVDMDTDIKLQPYFSRVINDRYHIEDVYPSTTDNNALDDDYKVGMYNFYQFDTENNRVNTSVGIAATTMATNSAILSYQQDTISGGNNVGYDLFVNSASGTEHQIALAGISTSLTDTEYGQLSSYSSPDTTKSYAVKEFTGYKNFNMEISMSAINAKLDALLTAQAPSAGTVQLPVKKNSYPSTVPGSLRAGHDVTFDFYVNIGVIPVMLHTSTDWTALNDDHYATLLSPATFGIKQAIRNIKVTTDYNKSS